LIEFQWPLRTAHASRPIDWPGRLPAQRLCGRLWSFLL